jgi:hypothetical protein
VFIDLERVRLIGGGEGKVRCSGVLRGRKQVRNLNISSARKLLLYFKNILIFPPIFTLLHNSSVSMSS